MFYGFMEVLVDFPPDEVKFINRFNTHFKFLEEN